MFFFDTLYLFEDFVGKLDLQRDFSSLTMKFCGQLPPRATVGTTVFVPRWRSLIGQLKVRVESWMVGGRCLET